MSKQKPEEQYSHDPYFVEVDEQGCLACGADRTWTIIGPDRRALSTSWDDEETAAQICEWLNAAYVCGQTTNRQMTATKSIKIERLHDTDGYFVRVLITWNYPHVIAVRMTLEKFMETLTSGAWTDCEIELPDQTEKTK